MLVTDILDFFLGTYWGRTECPLWHQTRPRDLLWPMKCEQNITGHFRLVSSFKGGSQTHCAPSLPLRFGSVCWDAASAVLGDETFIVPGPLVLMTSRNPATCQPMADTQYEQEISLCYLNPLDFEVVA